MIFTQKPIRLFDEEILERLSDDLVEVENYRTPSRKVFVSLDKPEAVCVEAERFQVWRLPSNGDVRQALARQFAH
jgi:hypothetical protein